MEHDPKSDVSFQNVLKGILQSVFSPPMPIEKLSDDEDKQQKKVIADLIDLRTDFVCVVLLFERSVLEDDQAALKRMESEAQQALTNLNVVRNTKRAQDFLMSRPQFFTKLDRRIYKNAQEIRKSRM